MEALRSADEIRDVNTRYHDVAAASYDSKWGIDFGAVGQAQVVGKLRKLLGPELHHGFGRSLEIGAGTGYFSLNLLQAAKDAVSSFNPGGMMSMIDLGYFIDPRYDTYNNLTLLQQDLQVMDASAISLCMDNNLPIVVFNMRESGNIMRVVQNQPGIGTLVCLQKPDDRKP